MNVDLASQASIRNFAERLRSAHPRLDVLINDAGVYLPKRETTADGIDGCFAVNVLAYHMLVRELVEPLAKAAPSRVINVASDFAGDPDLDDLQFERRHYDGLRAYRQSKACDRLLTWAWARRLESRGITVNAVAPGLVITNLYRHTSFVLHAFMRLLARRIGHTVEEGADTIIWLASTDEVEGITGKFFDRRKAKPCQFANPADEERLFEICEQLTSGSRTS
jgi:NAD(P)-dependent dehydrogenase (short-subunit alcohol dehydrogenase family)